MKDLVERELDWIIDSPAFFGPVSHLQAAHEQLNKKALMLPGNAQFDDQYVYLSTLESHSLIRSRAQRQLCAEQIVNELQVLHTGRLGLVFEKYLEEILKFRFGLEQVRYHVPVREKIENIRGCKTWGEFDFLIFDLEKSRIEHWETSIKFYLQVRDDPAWRFCWGPGVIDRLDLKGPKMFLQQLGLSSTELGRKIFPQNWVAQRVVKRVFAKGTLFYFWDPAKETFEERRRQLVIPTSLASDHLKSWWIYPESIVPLRDVYPNHFVALLPRRYWMTGLPPHQVKDVAESWDDFMKYFTRRSLAASERKECLYIALYPSPESVDFETAGFVATPHFIRAQGEKISAV